MPNTLTGEGNLSVDITFESMDDFSPAAVARKVEPLSKLLEARQQLSNLMTYMDGKSGAEELMRQGAAGPGAAADARRDDEARKADPPDPDKTTVAENSHGRPENPAGRDRRRIGAVEASDFASLLKKEFKPKTDEAKEAVEQAVRTLAEQALSQTTLIGSDVVKSIEAIIAELDKKLTEQINLILHHADFQKLEGAWRGLHYLVNNTETDEMLKIRVMNISQEGSRQDAEALQGHGLGPEPDLQEDLRGGVRPVRRRAVRLPGRRLLLRPQRRRTSSCCGEMAQDRRRGARAVHRRRRRRR